MKKVRPIFNGAELAASLIYICSISAALMYVLCRSRVFICTAIMTAVCFGIFWVFYKLRLKKILGLLTFVGLLILVNIVCSSVGSGYGEGSFRQFIFTSSDFFNPLYAGAAILLFSMIIGFSSAYFTVYLPRPCFLLLPAFIPLILAARTLGSLPIGYTIFMAVGFFFAVMGLARPESPKGEVYIDDGKARRERLIAMCALGIIAALILMIVPKVEATRYGDIVDNIILNPSRRNYFGSQRLSNFQDRTVPNTGNNTPSTNTLFTVITGAPMNVSKGSFDVYNGKDGWSWIDDRQTTGGYSDWEKMQRTLNYSSLISKLKLGVSKGKLEKYKDELDRVPETRYYNATMTIRVTDNSNTSVVLHPSKTYNVSINGYDGAVYRNSKDEIFTTENFGTNGSYLLNYFVEAPNVEFIDMLERVEIDALLSEALYEEVITSTDYGCFTKASIAAREYGENVYGDYDPRIKALADEITEGLSNDYEKARAIEQWFGEAGFVYDLDFAPEESTAEYFLFESKRGICTDFASAATLLLRAAGLSARYTEGFTLPDSILDNFGRYMVTAAQAHAYAEVFIEGYGWLTVDGTRYAAVSSSIEEALRVVAIVIVCTAAVLIILSVVFRRQLSELFFSVSLKFKDKSGKIRAIYLRTRKLACRITDRDPRTATAAEVLDIINRTLYITTEAEEIAAAANELIYAKVSPDVDERQLYQNYKKIRDMKRSLKR